MTNAWPPNSRPSVIVDPNAGALFDPSTQTVVGIDKPFWGEHLLWALPMTQSGMQRYLPNHPPDEVSNFGMDFSMVAPYGVQLVSGTLTVWFNTAAPTQSDDWTIGAVTTRGRALYALMAGGAEGIDYQFRWTASDNQGNIWPRAALVLCAQTS